jgi:hypothetical protein
MSGMMGEIEPSHVRAELRWLEPFEWLLMGLWQERAGEDAIDVELDVKAYASGGGG